MPRAAAKTSSSSAASGSSSSRRRSRASGSSSTAVIAPGGGTARDLANLGRHLGLDAEAVGAVMNARGRGTRRGDPQDSSSSGGANVKGASAWADFMSDMGGGGGGDEPASKKARTGAAAAVGGAIDENGPRSYDLPLRPRVRLADKDYDDEGGDAPAPGRLAQSGTLDTACVGRSKRTLNAANAYDLAEPTLLVPKSIFGGIKIASVATSSSSCHSIAIDVNGVPYGWGRNETHQLGSSGGVGGGASACVALPARLEGQWESTPIVGAATGKGHTVLVDAEGMAYAAGSNNVGQCGINHASEEVRAWRKCVLVGAGGKEGRKAGSSVSIEVVQVACGENFSVLLTTQGHIYTAGLSEFGQLGNGATGEYFISANKMGFANSSKFERRPLFVQGEFDAKGGFSAGGKKGKKEKMVPLEDSADIAIGSIACGRNHTVAVEARPTSGQPSRVFTWGCGGYGCLGHGVQADQYTPRLVATLRGPLFAANSPVRAAAGTQCSMALTANGHVYYWGKHRSVGEATMRPSLVDVLVNNGHVVTGLAGGAQTVFCSTKNGVTVGWGNGPHGELGYGHTGPKSSAKPKFVEKLDSCIVSDVACGYGHTLFLIRDEDEDVADFAAAAAASGLSDGATPKGKGRKKK
uniref:Uncharacterized protein n=1 Tax=Odontella aurita TaxID=265563 RepID=A0A7S4HXX2_9STRA|mmetsp:Transcript_16762/g.48256  ORF Transcript_16762/g.48256 Transcript_16762/m.48256 type:complete len:637 (+) Transcript_16762:289-2199(+)